jgi:hypothetical protein
VASEPEVRLDTQLGRRQPQVLEAGDRGLGKGRVCEVGQRRAAPQRQGLAQVLGCGLGVVAGERTLAGLREPFEPLQVELLGRQIHGVARWARDEQLTGRPQCPAQLRDPDA